MKLSVCALTGQAAVCFYSACGYQSGLSANRRKWNPCSGVWKT